MSAEGQDQKAQAKDPSRTEYHSLRALRYSDEGISRSDYNPITFRSTIAFPDQDSHTVLGTLTIPDTMGQYLTTRIIFRSLENWKSDITFEIVAHIKTPGGNSAALPSQHTPHKWTFRLPAQTEARVFENYPAQTRSTNARAEDAFNRYCLNDTKGREYRNKGVLTFVEVQFDKTVVHTAGILIERSVAPIDFLPAHDLLYRVFDGIGDNTITLQAFVVKMGEATYQTQLEDLHQHIEPFNNSKPQDLWYNRDPTHRPRVQEGQVTPAGERPAINLPYQSTYSDAGECWTVEGFAVLQAKEVAKAKCEAAADCDCEIRILRTSAGGDNEYLALIRVSEGFEYRLKAHDHLKLEYQNETWTATVLDQPFLYSSTADTTLALHRPIYDEGWSETQFENIFDLSTKRQDSTEKDIIDFCFSSPPNKVTVRPVYHDKPDKFKLTAIRILNDAHALDKYQMSNLRFTKIILGQDLRTKDTVDVFRGQDVLAMLRHWGIELNATQLQALSYFQALPNSFGLIKGPWGTGKTLLDVVITMLLLGLGKRVKVLSPSNDAADGFVIKLNEQIALLRAAGIELTSQEVVRVHALATESHVTAHESRKWLPDTELASARRRWHPREPMPAMVYDKLAYDLINASKTNLHGIRDRRYKLHESSLGSLVLRKSRLADRPPPTTTHPIPPIDPINAATPQAPTIPVTGAGHTTEEEAGNALQAPDNSHLLPHLRRRPQSFNQVQAAKDVSEGVEIQHHGKADGAEDALEGDGSNFDELSGEEDDAEEANKAQAREAQARYKAAKDELDAQLRLLPSAAARREFLIIRFREYFLQIEAGIILPGDEILQYRLTEKMLTGIILDQDVGVVVTTLIGSGDSVVREWEPDHVIIQEAARTQNSEVFIGMAYNANGTMHLSGDDEQLRPPGQEYKENCFAPFVNRSMFERLFGLGYPHVFLNQQYRTANPLGTWISDTYYYGRVQCAVVGDSRPNLVMASQVHTDFCQIAKPFLMLDVRSTSVRVGASRSKQNEHEANIAIDLAARYLAAGVLSRDIVILTGYTAQVQLIRRALIRAPAMAHIRCVTIDSFQGEESPFIILTLVGHDSLGFMTDSERQLVAFSRARDAMVIIGNMTGMLDTNRRPNKLEIFKRKFVRNGAYSKWAHELSMIPFMDTERNLRETGNPLPSTDDGDGQNFAATVDGAQFIAHGADEGTDDGGTKW